MKHKKLLLIATLALSSLGHAQDNKLEAPSARFWTRRTIIEYSTMNIVLASDGYWTNHNNGPNSYEVSPIARPFVNNAKGTAGYFAAISTFNLGIAYLLHKTGHHRLEHIPYYNGIAQSTWGTLYCVTHQ